MKIKRIFSILFIILLINVISAQNVQYGMMSNDGQFYPINSYGYTGMMGMMYGSYGGGMMFFGWVFILLVLIALVLLIIWLLKQINKEKTKRKKR